MSICFMHEWRNANGKRRAIPHLNTKNTSFLRTCALLKNMGVKNYFFPLALYDPDLRNVDPHDLEENTPENEILRTKVMKEARINVWYYLREVARVYEQGGSPVPFRLDRGSVAMTFCFINGIDYAGMQPRQTGKALALDSLIKVPGGWIRMGDVKEGDIVSMPDGTTAPVLGVYPQGERDNYRVTFEDGRVVECDIEHLWKVHWSAWGEEGGGNWRVKTLKEIMEHMATHEKSHNRLSVPLIEPEQSPDVDLPIDPYVLGVILGDGTITQNEIRVCKPDQFIKDELDRILSPHYRTSNWHADGKSYCITAMNGQPHLRNILQDLGIHGKLSCDKFIPKIYMNASHKQRLALIQGLLDTDGTVETPRLCKDGVTPKHGAVEYSTTSPWLASQFQELIWSIGGLCKKTKRQTYYTYNGEKRAGKLSYRVNPRVKDRSSLFRLPRKRDLTLGAHKYEETLKLAIRKIERIGTRQMQCIEVDHPDHLFITDNYVVTHNTVCALTLMAWILYTAGQEFQMGMMAKDSKLAVENVKRVRTFGENLPPWWIAEDRLKDKKNTEELYYNELKTHYQSFVAQKDASQADLQARGASPPVFHFDEFDYIANIDVSYPTILASTGTSRENAKKNGKPHSNIITTTAGDPMKPECKAAAKIMEGAMPFSEHLFDAKNREDLHRIVEASSPKKMVLGVFSHQQLGYDNKWLRDKITRNSMTADQVARDYLNRRVSIQEDPIIPKEVLAIINSSQMEPKYFQIMSNKFVIRWYITEEQVKSQAFRNIPIVIGCDSSEMIGKDCTTLVGINPSDLSVVFTFRASEGNINVLGSIIANLLMMYPKMIFVPENKSSGTSIIDTVALILREEGHNPFTRMFNWIVNNKHEAEFAKYNIRETNLIHTAAKKFFGIKTDKSKRDELYSTTLIQAARKSASLVRDKVLISELGSLTVRNGRVDHEVGGNDDTVIAWLMAMWFIFNAKHLDVYGIPPGTVMRNVHADKPDLEKLRAEKQQRLRDKIEELQRKLKLQRDVGMQKMIQLDIDALSRSIENGPIPLAATADEFHRDPKRFTDPVVAESSRTPVDAEEVANSLKAILGLR